MAIPDINSAIILRFARKLNAILVVEEAYWYFLVKHDCFAINWGALSLRACYLIVRLLICIFERYHMYGWTCKFHSIKTLHWNKIIDRRVYFDTQGGPRSCKLKCNQKWRLKGAWSRLAALSWPGILDLNDSRELCHHLYLSLQWTRGGGSASQADSLSRPGVKQGLSLRTTQISRQDDPKLFQRHGNVFLPSPVIVSLNFFRQCLLF